MTKPAFKPTKILWVDLEMTGLNPDTDKILEVAAIVTDWEFHELGTFEAVIHQPDEVLETMNEWCVAQHGASGLTQKSREADEGDASVEARLVEFVRSTIGDDGPVLLAGNSIHMDRRFIEKQWHDVDALLHYRMLDVSAWKVVMEGKFGKKFAKPEAHRALEDIRGSIAELTYYLGKFRVS